jgi:hypothetical protein
MSTALSPTPPLTPPTVRLKTTRASHGLSWQRQGLRVFFRKPVWFCALLGFWLLGMMLLAQLAWIGTALILISWPSMNLIFMLISAYIAQRKDFSHQALEFKCHRLNRTCGVQLLKLGAYYGAAMVGILLLCHWLDSGKLLALLSMVSNRTQLPLQELQKLISDPQLQQGMLWRTLLMALCSLLFWHTPALVYWGQQTASKSLFFNLVALGRSKAAFFSYALAAMVLLMVLSTMGALLSFLLGQPQWLEGSLNSTTALLFTSMFYASVFFSFSDSFEIAT